VLENAIKEGKEGVKITLEATPGAKKSEIGYDERKKAITMKVKNPPKKGKANREITEKLKEIFNAEVEIISGHTSSKNVVLVADRTKEEVVDILKKVVQND